MGQGKLCVFPASRGCRAGEMERKNLVSFNKGGWVQTLLEAPGAPQFLSADSLPYPALPRTSSSLQETYTKYQLSVPEYSREGGGIREQRRLPLRS